MKGCISALISTALFCGGLGGCGGSYKLDDLGKDGLKSTEQSGIGFNGIGFNGIGFNGIGFNGIGFNGIGFNGIGFNGIGFNGIGFNGLGWDPASGTWVGWNSAHSDWDLDAWINNSEADGILGITSADREIRLKGLAYWAGCACPSGTSPTWVGNNPYGPSPETRTFDGLFGLATTWCSGSGPVPVGELQAVSACLFARLNADGKHNVLSNRGYESSLALGDNEQLFMAYLSTKNWGNLWEDQTHITDPSDGSTYSKASVFGCYFPWGNAEAQLAQDLQVLLGRTFEWNPPTGMKSTLACLVPGTPTWLGGDGSMSTGMPGTTPDPVIDTVTFGPTSSNWSTYPSPWDADEYVKWRGNYWRQMTTYLGAWADLEDTNWKDAAYQCNNTCPGAIPGGGYTSFSSCSPNGGGPPNGGGGEGQGSSSGYRGGCANPDPRCEHPTIWNICQTKVYDGVSGAISQDCTPKSQCVAGRKLVSMPAGQWLRVEFTRPYRYNFTTASWDLNIGTVNPHKAGTLAFHYSNSSPGNAGILIQDRLRGFALTPVTDFPPTGGDDNYAVHTVYPWYPVAPASPSSGELGVDIDIGSGAGTFPHLDYVQMWVGPPIGGKSNEMWWNDEAVDLEQGTLCVNVEVESSSDISSISGVRVRPQVSGAKLSDLKVTLSHGNVTFTPRRFDSATSWSEWIPRFTGQNPQQDPWQVCVTSSQAAGTLDRVDIELKQR